MNSVENNFVSVLLEIREELAKYATISKDKLFTECINKKLQQGLEKYEGEIQKDVDFLSVKGEAMVLKALTKLQCANDKINNPAREYAYVEDEDETSTDQGEI